MSILKIPSHFSKEVVERFYPTNKTQVGFPLQWGNMAHCRIRPAELSIWTGVNGHGKSMLLNQALVIGGALNGKQSLVCSLEMKPSKTLQRMLRQITACRMPDADEIRRGMVWMDSYVTMYDYIGRGEVGKLIHDFSVAADKGVEVFIIDSLMCLGVKEDDYNAQKETVHSLQLWAQKNNVHLALVAHARKGSSEVEKPGKLDVLGSSHITNMADAVWSVWRNKPKEEKVNNYRAKGEKAPISLLSEHDAVLECSKSREGDDEERMYRLWYDTASLQYRCSYDLIPMPFYEEVPF